MRRYDLITGAVLLAHWLCPATGCAQIYPWLNREQPRVPAPNATRETRPLSTDVAPNPDVRTPLPPRLASPVPQSGTSRTLEADLQELQRRLAEQQTQHSQQLSQQLQRQLASGLAAIDTAGRQDRDKLNSHLTDQITAAVAEPQLQASQTSQRLDALSGGVEKALQIAGIAAAVGGTGGVAALAIPAASALIRFVRRRRQSKRPAAPEADADKPFPVPRDLVETRQLLELAKTEGRVAPLDTLRGMFVDDELERLIQGPDGAKAQFAKELKYHLANRVNDAAPVSVTA